MKHFFSEIQNILFNWWQSLESQLPNIFLGLVIFVLFLMAARGARSVILSLYKNSKKHKESIRITATVIYVFLLLSGIYLAFKTMGLEKAFSNLLAGAGIVGIIAGFAFKDVASNIFAGLLLKIHHPFALQDWVEIDGNYGFVSKIGWITTAIDTVRGQEVYVPNQLIYSSSFTNYSAFKKRRVVVKSGVSYGDDLDKVKSIALEEVYNINLLLSEEPIDFYYTDIGSSTFNFELRFWIHFDQNKDYKEALSEGIMRIKKRFESEGISIAYNVTTLDFGVKGGVNIFDKPLEIHSQ